MMTSRANRVGAHSETMIFTRATHKVSLQPISMICPKVAGRSLAEGVNLPARCCTLLSSAVKMAELEQQLREPREGPRAHRAEAEHREKWDQASHLDE